MERKNIGIIGIKGGYGQWLERKLTALGHIVIGSDIGTDLSNTEVAKASEVLFTTVPISASIAVLSEVAPLMTADQLWIDLTGQKTKQMEIMFSSKANVLGLHPMCSPSFENWSGQAVIMYGGVPSVSHTVFYQSFLEAVKADKLVWLTPQDHDKYVLEVQRMTSSYLIGWMNAIASSGLDPEILSRCTSPTFRLMMEAATRMGGQPGVYQEILATSPQEQENRDVKELITEAMEFFAKVR